MAEDRKTLLSELIDLELNVAGLYRLFHEQFHNDSAFWWQLSMEEMNHAALLKAVRDEFMPSGFLPAQIIPENLAQLIETNNELQGLLNEYKRNPPSREDAFRLAVKLERSAGESHYQQAMGLKVVESPGLAVLQRLNSDDKDHETRLLAYMKQNGISP